jgi:hypothetical protein
MMIPESLLEQALALVFDGKAAGERLSFYDMTQQWNRLGLRLADLRDAVRETVDRHFLRVQDQQGMLVFELTAAGQARFHKCRNDAGGLQQWLQRMRASQSDDPAWNPLGESWDRRATQS